MKGREGTPPGEFEGRDVYRNGWSRLSDKNAVKAAADLLIEHGWLVKIEDCDTGGRDARRYEVHPEIATRGRALLSPEEATPEPEEASSPPKGKLTKPTKVPSVGSVGSRKKGRRRTGSIADVKPDRPVKATRTAV